MNEWDVAGTIGLLQGRGLDLDSAGCVLGNMTGPN